MTFQQLDRLAREAGYAPANDNPAPDAPEWAPPRQARTVGAPCHLPGHGPTIVHRLRAQAAWSDAEWRPADNQNWPLSKVLKADGLDHALALATRYRDVHDRASAPVQLIGRDPGDDIYIARRTDLDPSTGALRDKGVRRIKGGAHPKPESDATFHGKRPKPVPKKWNGDRPLIDRLDAGDELAGLRAELSYLLEPFEAAVVDGDTLDAVGRRLGAGQGAGAAGRAIVLIGIGAIDQFWQRRRRAA